MISTAGQFRLKFYRIADAGGADGVRIDPPSSGGGGGWKIASMLWRSPVLLVLWERLPEREQ